MVSRFRVKKLSPKHPLTIYKESQLPDIHDAGNLQRAVPLIETGVDKDEEDEVRTACLSLFPMGIVPIGPVAFLPALLACFATLGLSFYNTKYTSLPNIPNHPTTQCGNSPYAPLLKPIF